MPTNLEAARECISRCIKHRDDGRLEAVLKHELTSWLRPIFHDEADAAWVNHYSEGTETTTKVLDGGGTERTRFIDTLIRATVIEYEPDLRRRARFEVGYAQVREYAAGAIRSGVPASALRGILSDTVDWYVYDVRIPASVAPARCRLEDVELQEIERLELKVADGPASSRFVEFLRKHLARQQSRTLSAASIAGDLGLSSSTYDRHAEPLRALVIKSRKTDKAVQLATGLWAQFVDHIETGQAGFRCEAYVDEAYMAVLARLLSANVLSKVALLSDDGELTDILAGRFFENRFHLRNMVEQDYFGWLWREPTLTVLLPTARAIQQDLYAYAFDRVLDDDLFGHMLAEVARRSHRKLLGQESTPAWLARALAERCVSALPQTEAPRVLDMCCGSGAILSAVIKELRDQRPTMTRDERFSAVCGFDIDPLAVMLAKTTWVIAFADDIRAASEAVSIPMYHADSLFAVTPITRELPLPSGEESYKIDLDGHVLSMPGLLLQPRMLSAFDGIVDWAYDEARSAEESGSRERLDAVVAGELVTALEERFELDVDTEEHAKLVSFAFALACSMADLALARRNGIWAYILRNTYRPALLAGRFNGLVSNPPWLTLSQLANNPYKKQLSARAAAYGIKPSGSSHLHTELATTHLLHAIDRYLAPGSAVACLLPGTILNGQHHAKLRAGAYLEAPRPVAFELQEVWGIAAGTFRVRAIAVIGTKRQTVGSVRSGRLSGARVSADVREDAEVQVTSLGTRSAWLVGEAATGVGLGAGDVPIQGADLMPRPAVCVVVSDQRGAEWGVRTPRRGDADFFVVRDAKRIKGASFSGRVAPEYIHRMAQSLNLLPFYLDDRFATIALPAVRTTSRQWRVADFASMRSAGHRLTAKYFELIDEALEREGVVKNLAAKIDERRKLTLQKFEAGDYLVLNGAGGGIVCAAVMAVNSYPDVVIDQTLYWRIVKSRNEAYFRVGLLNSDAITSAIRPLVPEGELGPRHLHTLPNRVIPTFHPADSHHAELASVSRALETEAGKIARADSLARDLDRPIASRRRRVRLALSKLPEYSRLERLSRVVLGL